MQHVWKKRITYKVLVGNPEGKRPLGRPRHRLEYNTKMGVRGIGWSGMDWIDLSQASWLPASCWFLSWLIHQH
jgi:hypothetical protein